MSLEPDSDFIVSNKSCISFPNACAGFCDEPVDELESVDVADEVESLDEADEAAEVDEFELALPSGGGGIERPIWLNACMTLCISAPFPESDPPSVC